MSHPLTSLGIRALVAACAALLVAGCSSDDGRPAPSVDTSWVDFYIERAQEGDSRTGVVASEAQLAILERGRVQGELTMADVTEAIHNSAACLEDLGLHLTMGAPQTGWDGFESPAYNWGGPRSLSPEELAAMGDPCLDAESSFVESAYNTQPRAIEASEAYFDEHMRSTMVACLERNGVDFNPEGSQRELWDAAGAIALDLYSQGYEVDEVIASGRDCIHESFILHFEEISLNE